METQLRECVARSNVVESFGNQAQRPHIFAVIETFTNVVNDFGEKEFLLHVGQARRMSMINKSLVGVC